MSCPTLLAGFLTRDDVDAILKRIDDAVAQGTIHQEAGRQGTGYWRVALDPLLGPEAKNAASDALSRAFCAALVALGEPPAWDAWFLTYPDASAIPPHRDPSPAEGFAHLRLNILLDAGDGGGAFLADGEALPLAVGDAVRFRPDVVEHAVEAVRRRRCVLSVGTIWPLEGLEARFPSGGAGT